MDLADASVFFDDDPLYEAYTGDYLYEGQFATYDGSQLDGSFIRRRTVSLAPDLVVPYRRVVTLYGEQWVLSDPIRDGFYGEVVRQTMSARKCHALYSIMTAGELATLSPATRTAYGFCNWKKNLADASTTNLEPYFEFSFASTEPSIERKFFVEGGRIWHSRVGVEITEGFMFAEADELVGQEGDTGRVLVSVEGEPDPVTLQTVQGPAVPAVMVQRYQFFTKGDQAQEPNYPEDKTLIVAKAGMPNPKGNLKISGHTWSILANQDLSDGWGLHIRRVS